MPIATAACGSPLLNGMLLYVSNLHLGRNRLKLGSSSSVQSPFCECCYGDRLGEPRGFESPNPRPRLHKGLQAVFSLGLQGGLPAPPFSGASPSGGQVCRINASSAGDQGNPDSLSEVMHAIACVLPGEGFTCSRPAGVGRGGASGGGVEP